MFHSLIMYHEDTPGRHKRPGKGARKIFLKKVKKGVDTESGTCYIIANLNGDTEQEPERKALERAATRTRASPEKNSHSHMKII